MGYLRSAGPVMAISGFWGRRAVGKRCDPAPYLLDDDELGSLVSAHASVAQQKGDRSADKPSLPEAPSQMPCPSTSTESSRSACLAPSA
jgi:hypothetical protein